MTSYQIAIPKTFGSFGIAEAISAELEALGHRPVYFPLPEEAPKSADIIFFFGPFGKFLHIPQKYSGLSRKERPRFIYWNTEGLPDPRLPWPVVRPLSLFRSWLGRASGKGNWLAGRPPLSKVDAHLLRFRYVGDYFYAYRRGWVDVFADISEVYATTFREFGIPAIAAPFGSFQPWYADLGLKRDIDVLWMGKRGSKRRSQAVDRLREELRARGVDLYMVDNEEHPFVFGEERTHLLNRTKITLNLLRTWYDENSLRICMAAPNRSLVVSEPLLPHVPHYQAGVNYVAAPLEQMADTIVYYLEQENERQRIVENAYLLTTQVLTFRCSMQKIMDAVEAPT